MKVTNRPAVRRPRKNLFNKDTMTLEFGALDGSSGGNYKDQLYYTMRTGLIPVEPNTTYVYNKPGDNYINVSPYPFNYSKQYLGSGTRPTVTQIGTLTLKFTTPSNCHYVKLQLNRNDINAVLTDSELQSYKNTLQLEKNSDITPYESYQEDNKLASLVPKKNLVPKLSDAWFKNGNGQELIFEDDYRFRLEPSGNYRYVAYRDIPVKIGQRYTVSANITGSTSTSVIRVFKTSDLSSSNIVARNGESFTVDSSYGGVITLVLSNGDQMVSTTISNFQIEEGPIATPFEPYQLVAKGTVPTTTKNLISSSLAYDSIGTVNFTRDTNGDYTIDFGAGFDAFIRDIKVKPYTQYTLYLYKVITSNDVSVTIRDKSNNNLGGMSASTSSVITFNSDANSSITLRFARSDTSTGGKVKITNLQLQEGPVATTFAPYQNKNKSTYANQDVVTVFDQWVNDGAGHSLKGYGRGQSFVSMRDYISTITTRMIVTNTTSGLYTTMRILDDAYNTVAYSILPLVVNPSGQTTSDYIFKFNTPVVKGKTYYWMIDEISGVTSYDVHLLKNETPNTQTKRIYKQNGGYYFPEMATYQFKIYGYNETPSVPKAAANSYPFTFQRESVEFLGNKQYGHNTPRIKKDALLMEEPTVNLLGNYTSPSSWSLSAALVAGELLYENTDTVIHRISKSISGMIPGKQYSISASVKDNGRRYAYFNADAFMQSKATLDLQTGIVTIGRGTAFAEKLDDGWYRFTLVGTAGPASATIFFQLNNSSVGTDTNYTGDGVTGLYVKDFQMEERNFPTSFTPKERKIEYAYIEDADKFIDATQGSIEYTVTPIIDSTIYPPSGYWGWNDLVYYDDISNGFLIRRCNEAIGGHSMWVQGVEKTYDLAYKSGDEIKYKFEWDASGSRLYANGSMIATTGTKFVTPSYATAKRLYIGCRSTASRKQGNASYKDIFIKDRNGNITWQL